MRAIISDIHSNLEALDAVLCDIDRLGIHEIYCLGDVVGYGPNPCECINLAMGFQRCLLGEHEQAILFDPEGFSTTAERAVFWSRQLMETLGDITTRGRRWDFLGDLPRSVEEAPFGYFHGSPRNPLNEYVWPEDVYNRRKLEKVFSLVEQYAFMGHTHVPGIFTNPGIFTKDFRYLSEAEVRGGYKLDGRKTLINVGSVGQPGDGNPDACYVMLDGDTIQFRRIRYRVSRTVGKIYAIPDLDNFIGDCLTDGEEIR